MLNDIQRHNGCSGVGIFIINEVDEVGRISDAIQHKIQNHQKALVSFSGVLVERQNRKKNKQKIDIQNGSCVKG